MTTISRLSTSYSVIAPTSYNSNQKALNDLAAAAGNDAPPTRISLTSQAQELSGFAQKLVGLTTANSTFESSRGIAAAGSAQDELKTAYTNASNRLRLAGIQANGAQNAQQGSALLGAKISSVADFLTQANADAASYGGSSGGFDLSFLGGGSSSGNSSSDYNDIFSTLSKQYKKKNAAFAKALSLKNGQKNTTNADPFDRKLATKYATNGGGSLEVKEVGLKGSSLDVAIQKGLVPDDKIKLVTTIASGRPSSTSDGFSVNVTTGKQNSVVAIDTRDPLESDTRTSAVNVTTGDGSNVVYLAGTNDSVIKTGKGDSFVVAEGNSIVYGGTGNDFIAGNNVIGGGGNDNIFASQFAYGGDGNNKITLFSVTGDPPDPKKLPLAVAGNGNNTVIADIQGNAIVGNGNNTIVLRQGGSIAAGDGANKITTEGSADVTAGNGKNDIFLAAGGSVTVGNGSNTIAASAYASATVGKGDNQIQFQAGGALTYTAGGGTNQVLFGAPLQKDTANLNKLNTITLNGLLYSDVTLTPVQGAALIQEKSGSGQINVTSVGGANDLQLIFVKDGKQQIVTVHNGGGVDVGGITKV